MDNNKLAYKLELVIVGQCNPLDKPEVVMPI